MRKNYIDNLRNYAILLLFPVHTFMIWNNFGSRFYVWMGENRLLSTLIVLVNPWFMPLLFVLAGMSARYALERRTVKEFVRQRVQKLFVPLVAGILLLVPAQALYARKFYYQYEGGIGEHYKYFFTHLTDFSGYDGAFTPGHLWFILFLLLKSKLKILLFSYLQYQKAAARVERLPALGVLLLLVPVWLMYYLGNFGGFSLGKCLALYLAGYYITSNDRLMEKVEKKMRDLAVLCLLGTVLSVALYYRYSYYGDLWVNFIGWTTILFLLVCGKKYLNHRGRVTEWLNRASYPIYILHQTILVAVAYYIVRACEGTAVQAACIWAASFVLTMAACWLGSILCRLLKLIVPNIFSD